MRRAMLTVILLASGLVSSTAHAQSEPRLVQTEDGILWVVFEQGTRYQITPQPLPGAALSGILTSVPSESGVIYAPPLPDTTLPSETESLLPGVAGQQATGTFSSMPIRATVKEMRAVSVLPTTPRPNRSTPYAELPANGKFIIVLADVENLGTQAVCCLPGYRLRDGRGRLFTGDANQADQKVAHAAAAFYPSVRYESDDYQPNLPRTRVFVFDIPVDATDLSLVSDR
jgi:hypothetical protein